jgi:hydroxymethylpyrimidine/phosphomethylpyrimidine kinase
VVDDPAIRIILTIAGSDPSGGAGLQADLRTFALHGLHGCAVVAGITVQNTRGVRRMVAVEPGLVADQLTALLDDLRPACIKTGMLASAAVVDAVADVLARRASDVPLVIDPVLVASSGASLLSGDGVTAYRRLWRQRSALITPNFDEAAALLRSTVDRVAADPASAALALREAGAQAVLVTGGHSDHDPVDTLVDSDGVVRYRGSRIDTPHTHGTGCLLSAAIAAAIARGADLRTAIRHGKACVEDGLRNGTVADGKGRGWVRLLAVPDLPPRE